MWYSKKLATTETATYVAKFCAGRTCIEQVVDLRNALRYFVVPLHKTSYIYLVMTRAWSIASSIRYLNKTYYKMLTIVMSHLLNYDHPHLF